jgi:hypothetical protein
VRASVRRVSVVDVRVFRACARGERLLGVINIIIIKLLLPVKTALTGAGHLVSALIDVAAGNRVMRSRGWSLLNRFIRNGQAKLAPHHNRAAAPCAEREAPQLELRRADCHRMAQAHAARLAVNFFASGPPTSARLATLA